MGRTAIDHYLYLMDEAFSGRGDEHPLLTNLESVQDEDWRWLPDGGARSIGDIVAHVGECKYVYDNQAFGDRSMRWDIPGSIPSLQATATKSEALVWLEDGHRSLRASVEALSDDAELLAMRPAPWGQEYETRWIINQMIKHDLYHAGEINHIRSLHHRRDGWAYEND